MSNNIITLTADQLTDLRGKGQAFFDNGSFGIDPDWVVEGGRP